jgi:hypothetical protein
MYKIGSQLVKLSFLFSDFSVSQQGQSSQRPNRGRSRGKRPANNDGGAPSKVLKKISDVTNYVNKSASKPAVSASDESDVNI